MNDDPRIDPADLRNVRFPGSSRRYDARAVDQFLETVAARISATNALVDELQGRLAKAKQQAAEAPADAAPAAPAGKAPELSTLDEDALIRLVGEETTSVLSTARRAAADIRTKAEHAAEQVVADANAHADRVRTAAEERAAELTAQAQEAAERTTSEADTQAAEVLADARADAERRAVEAWAEADRVTADARAAADRLIAEAEQTAAEARADADRLGADARAESERIIADARKAAERDTADAWARLEAEQDAMAQERVQLDADAEAIIAEAREEGRSMVAEAKETRTRILEDLQRRRDAARQQVEVLLAGRDRLLAAYDAVRHNLDDVTDQLADAAPDPERLPVGELTDGFLGVVGVDGVHDEPPAAVDDTRVDDTRSEPPSAAADDTADAPVDEPASDHAGDSDADRWATDSGDIVDAEIIVDDASDEPAPDVEPVAEPDERTDTASSAAESGDRGRPARLRHLGRVQRDDDVPSAPVRTEGAQPTVADRTETGTAPTSEPVDVRPEPEPAPATEHPGDARAEDEGEDDMDSLFARLREAREESVTRAQQVLGFEAGEAADAPVDEAPTGEDAASEPPGEQVEDSTADRDTDDRDPDGDGPGRDDRDGDEPVATGADGAVGLTAAAAPAGGDQDVPIELLASDADLERRAEALGPLDTALNRALKRRLADEQNTVLDRLRRDGALDVDQLLPSIDEQVEAYAEAAASHLAAAAVAGAEAGGGAAGVEVHELSLALGATLAEPFRRRLERSAGEVAGDADELDERLRALYREWKVQHVGTAAQDALLSAYGMGTLAAARLARRVVWRIDPQQGPCSDAQDNALAGAVEAGEAFPTGDTCPQAHPGCRCVLVVE